MQPEPRREHRWLERLVGDWAFESDCVMGPDQPPMTSRGVETVRSLGGLWTIGEAEMEMPEGGGGRTIMTLGFDPQAGRFVGTFVASMMTHLWSYDGALDGDTLTLEAQGPSFFGTGTARYQDILQIVDDDHRTLTSRCLGEDGAWVEFMTARYRRTA